MNIARVAQNRNQNMVAKKKKDNENITTSKASKHQKQKEKKIIATPKRHWLPSRTLSLPTQGRPEQKDGQPLCF
jgi:hypothetical protein